MLDAGSKRFETKVECHGQQAGYAHDPESIVLCLPPGAQDKFGNSPGVQNEDHPNEGNRPGNMEYLRTKTFSIIKAAERNTGFQADNLHNEGDKDHVKASH